MAWKKNMKTQTNKKFASKVMAVVNRKAETKSYSTQVGFNALDSVSNTWKTWNLTNGVIRGTNESQVIGDKFFIKQLHTRMLFQNTNLAGSAIHTDGYCLRVVVFRGKYDYSLSNYPSGEVFEGNAGSTPADTIVIARIDRDQVTPLFDKVYYFSGAPLTGAIERQFKEIKIDINKSFNIRNDDNFGKLTNLYLGMAYTSATSSQSINAHTSTITFTDV